MSNKNIDEMKRLVKDTLVPLFSKESQLGRSLHHLNEKPVNFNEELLNSIVRLREEVDGNTLKNENIRDAITELSQKTGATIGQSQKVINVYLKYYCLLRECNDEIIKELDCPLDSTIFTNELNKSYKKLVSLENIDEYIQYQEEIKKRNGIRILADKKYDEQRMSRFLK